MFSRRAISIVILCIYMLGVITPLPSYAQADVSAVQAAVDSLGITVPTEGATGSGFGGEGDTDTGQSGTEAQQGFPSIQEQTSTAPEVTIINEKIDDEKKIGTTAAPDATVQTSPLLDPREISGSSMFNNLRERLRRFGSDFFAVKRSNSLAYAPVGPNYVVAPGDEVKVNLWGYNELRASLVVDRDGTLTLPQAGPISAAGLTFLELEKSIDSAYRRILNDFDLNVTMGKLHTINVYVTGHAARPGAYAVSSMATLIDVLSQAGGPAMSGSMRAIEVKRGNRTVAVFDVYNLLLKGDRTGDSRLADGDIIFVPTVGPLVAVAGNVKRPAIYEMTKPTSQLSDVIALAGGLASGAYKGRIQIVRVENNTFRTAFESDLNSPNAKARGLQDGDLLKIFAVPGGSLNVRIAGAVIQPGIYTIDPGVTTLGDILNRAGGLMYTAADEGELTRVEVSAKGPVTTRMMVNLKSAMSGSSPLMLQRDDYLFVRTVPDWNIYRSANITGRVLYPGNYAVKRGERLSSLLERSGGYAQGAFIRGAVFIRDSIRKDQQKNIDEMVAKLEREVMAAANEAVSTAVKQTDVAFAQASVTQKEKFIDTMKNLKASGRLVVDLPEDLNLIKGSAFDIELQEGDRLHIPEKPGTVQVIGSVLTPSAFIYRAGLPFSQYIKMAGGYTSTANPKRTYILKADGSTVRAFAGNRPRVLEEGDFVVVPEKIIFRPTMRNATDIMDIVYKMVVGIAAIDYVFK